MVTGREVAQPVNRMMRARAYRIWLFLVLVPHCLLSDGGAFFFIDKGVVDDKIGAGRVHKEWKRCN
jgi:hypothetical protein